jgi:arylsulfatase A-like enzyme
MVQHGVEVCPALNRLAAQGTAFSRAYTTCPLCVPARTALATGRYPTETGVVINDWEGASARDLVPVHQRLAAAGYDVAHVGVDHIRLAPPLRERVRFARDAGNEEHAAFLARRGAADDPAEMKRLFSRPIEVFTEDGVKRQGFSSARTARWPHPEEWFKDAFFCQEAIAFLQEPRPRPFALFLYLWAPHPPLRVPEPYFSRFDPARLALPDNVGKVPRGEPPGRRAGVAARLAEGYTLDDWRRAWAAHLGLVNLADAWLGRVLDALRASGHEERTLVAYTVDHGDHLGQRAMYQKMEMSEPALRVPLVFRGLGARRQRVDATVSHLDVVPTLLDLLGLPSDPSLPGQSLAACVARGEAPAERAAFAQYSGCAAPGDLRRAAVTRRYKYVHDPRDLPELYDLEADPLEMENLAGRPEVAGVERDLHARCMAWARARGDRRIAA